MNAVEKVKILCKERKIAISRVEKDLGFSNGYIGQLKKGTFPSDRLALIADYFGLPVDEFLDSASNQRTEGVSLQSLKDDERVLLDSYRGMSERDREMMRDFARRLREND